MTDRIAAVNHASAASDERDGAEVAEITHLLDLSAWRNAPRGGIQEATEEQRWRSLGATVRVRVGVNTGAVTEEGDDLYGQAVTAAARIAGRAQAGEILVSEVTGNWRAPARSSPFGTGAVCA
jgi:class 3 adenylate cyclase